MNDCGWRERERDPKTGTKKTGGVIGLPAFAPLFLLLLSFSYELSLSNSAYRFLLLSLSTGKEKERGRELFLLGQRREERKGAEGGGGQKERETRSLTSRLSDASLSLPPSYTKKKMAPAAVKTIPFPRLCPN